MTRQNPIELSRDPWGHLLLVDTHGNRYHEISVMPLFPISEPRKWISLLAADGREIMTLEDPADYGPEVEQALAEELNYRDFVPRILRVLSVSGTSEPCEWHVETNHGNTRFVLKAEDDIRRLSVFEVMIVDANGGRYRVDDTRRLDARSRRFIEWYV
jgi:hypothetical protein